MHLPYRLAPCALTIALLSAGCVSVPPGSMPMPRVSAAAGRSEPGPVARPVAASAAELNAAFRLGRQELMAGRVRSAIEHFAYVLDRDPHHVEALNAAAVAVAELDRLPEAVALLRRAVAIAPQAVHLRNNLGYALFRSGDLAQARAELRIALELQPNNALALRNLTLLGQASSPAAAAAPQAAAGGVDSERAAASPPALPAIGPAAPAMPAAGPLASEPAPTGRVGLAPSTAVRPLPPAVAWQAPPVAARPAEPGRLGGGAFRPGEPGRPAGGAVQPTGPDRSAVGAIGPAAPTVPVHPDPTLPARSSNPALATRLPTSQAARQALGLLDARAAAEPPAQASHPQSPAVGAPRSWAEEFARFEPPRTIRRRAGVARPTDPMVLRTLGLDSAGPAGLDRPAGGRSTRQREPIVPDRGLETRPRRGFEQAPYLIRVRPAAPSGQVPAVRS